MVTEKSPRTSQLRSKQQTATRAKKDSRPTQRIKIKHISLVSLVKVSFFFFVGLALVGTLATLVFWSILSAAGFVTKLNHLIDQLLGTTNYKVTLTQVIVIQLGFGVAWAIIATVISFVAGVIYNISSEVGNGIGITITDDSK
ncbi:MAG: DUF3566 domain-containing protein [Actinomycetota bacterium]|nr:DUF3566 domain-containing protein [Actinomycetota bacterium]